MQLRHIFLTDAATFMVFSWISFGAENDPRATQIVGRQLDGDLVAGEDADVVHPHLAGNVGKDFVSIFELDAEHRVGKWFNHYSLNEDRVVLGLGYGAPPGSGRAEKRAEVLRDDPGM